MKKLSSLLIAIMACAGTIFAESGTCGENLTWDLTGDVLTISGTGNMYNWSNQYGASGSHAPWQSLNVRIAIIEEGVTNIGRYAFFNCTHMTSISIPTSVTSIECGAFSNCYSLTTCNIPTSVNSIHGEVFNNCVSLDIEIPNSEAIVTLAGAYSTFTNVFNVVYNGTLGEEKWWNGARAVNGYVDGNLAYSDNSKTHLLSCLGNTVGNVIIPNSVTNIGERAFFHCTELTSVTIPESVVFIGERAFEDCNNLPIIDNLRYAGTYLVKAIDQEQSEYIIREGTKWIGSYAFAYQVGRSAVKKIVLPRSVIAIQEVAFADCYQLQDVYIHAITPPTITSHPFSNSVIIHVPFGGYYNAYKSAEYWKDLNIQSPEITHKIGISSTACSMSFDVENVVLASVGIEGGETFDGNILEQTGLDPNTEYSDQHIVLTAYTGETETINVSFTTTALELTTQQSQPVSSNTAILLAETNIAEIETSCGFEWKRTNAPDDMEGTLVYCPVANGVMAGRLKGLKDDVYYKYRAFYQSAAGNMYYGNWQYIFTGDATVEFDPIIYTYPATSVKENEATLKGYALAGSEDFSEQGFEYWAESRAYKAPRSTAAIGEHHTVTASGISMKATLTDLDAGTVYRYRSYAKIGSKLLYGSEMTLTTQGEYHDPQAIEDIQTEAPKATKVLMDGQIYILRGDKAYTITGQLTR